MIRPGVVNGGFETTSSSSPVPTLTVKSPAGTAAAITDAQSRSGSRSLSLTDSSKSAAITATSSPAVVFPGVTHNLRVWVRPSAGVFVVTVHFLNGDRRDISAQQVDVRKPRGVWG